MALAAHTIVKQIIDFAMAIFGTFSTVSQTLVASSLGKVSSMPPRNCRADNSGQGDSFSIWFWPSEMPDQHACEDPSNGPAFYPCAPTVRLPLNMMGQN